jgi:hypothetical protein
MKLKIRDGKASQPARPKTAAKDMTPPQIKIYEKLSDAARRLFNDLAKYPKYTGGASGEAALLELSKTKLIKLHHADPGKMPLAFLTPRGKQMAQRLMGSGRLGQVQAKTPAPKPKKLDRATKNKSVALFKKHGVDGNGRFPSVSRGLAAAWAALNKLGIGPGQVVTADLFKGDKGSRQIDLEWANTTDDPFMPGAEIPNSVLAISWQKMAANKFEILCYLS